jgi:hypothetical protein
MCSADSNLCRHFGQIQPAVRFLLRLTMWDETILPFRSNPNNGLFVEVARSPAGDPNRSEFVSDWDNDHVLI